jgi:peptidoglycan/xylan/chitin deacetylase (PgdA/CDA1 family)
VIRLKSILKRLIAQVLYSSGISWAVLAKRTRGRLLVLTYHRVLPDSLRAECFSAEGIIVTPQTFERHMRLLSRKFRVLTPDQAAAVLSGGDPMPPRACLVTFDDGWWDNLKFAAPILRHERVPALLFVATDYVGTDRVFWQEQLAMLLFSAWRAGTRARELLQRFQAVELLDLPESRARPAIRRIITSLKARSPAELADTITATARFLEETGIEVKPAATDRFLSWDEVKNLATEAPVAIGSHCCSHIPLTKLDAEQVARELESSRERIRTEAAIVVQDLAYPNGDCDQQTLRLTAAAGYRMAFSTESGYATPGDNPHNLRRINIHEHATLSDAMFVARLAGLT